MKNFRNSFIILTTAVLIVSCTGGGGSGGGSSKGQSNKQSDVYKLPSSIGTIEGIFLDSPVSGLTYSTPSLGNQATDGSGKFSCQAGEALTFKLGGFVIGKTQCLATITPLSAITNSNFDYHNITDIGQVSDGFADLTSKQNEQLGRLLQFFQTIDNDGDATNGISVDINAATAVQSLVSTQEEFDEIIDDHTQTEFDQSMIDLADAMGGSTVAQSNITIAMSHFKSTINNLVGCSTGDITGASQVSGTTLNCVAISCISGYSISNGACIDNSVPQASEVVSDAIDFYNVNYATADFIADTMTESDCTSASSYSSMKTLYADRSINNFLTSGAYLSERTCLDRMIKRVMLYSTDSSPFGLNRDDDFLEISGALDLTTSFFDVNGVFSTEELEVLELIFDDQI
jgi:hypothetical protein